MKRKLCEFEKKMILERIPRLKIHKINSRIAEVEPRVPDKTVPPYKSAFRSLF